MSWERNIRICMRCSYKSCPTPQTCVCTADGKGKGITPHAEDGDCPEKYFTPGIGLGDVVAAITTAMGVKPCESCEERRKRLNELLPIIK